MENPLVEKEVLLEKFPGKGGWTFARLPEIKNDNKNPFGWIKVKGLIDDHEISQYHLMPMGTGHLFLPVKAEIRKKIKKNAGDLIRIILYRDDSPLILPEYFLDCLKDEPAAYGHFLTLSDPVKNNIARQIQSAKNEEKRIQIMAAIINKLSRS